MSNRLITLYPRSCFSTELSPIPRDNSAHTLLIDEHSVSDGGQGIIYPLLEIDGVPIPDQSRLVKHFPACPTHPSVIPANIRGIVEALAAHKRDVDECSALMTMPLFLFEGTTSEGGFAGYVMRRFQGSRFSSVLERDLDNFIRVPWSKKLSLCLQFTQALKVLYDLTIVHADINGENVLIDSDRRVLVLIDLDGGAVAKSGCAPTVKGKPDPQWLAPEIWDQWEQQSVEVGMAADLWSIACGVHHLLFGLEPFFFIPEVPDRIDYLTHYRWPQLRGLHIATNNHDAFDYYKQCFKRSGALGELFRVSFQEGYLDPSRRITAYQWMQVIREQLKANRFSTFLQSVHARKATGPTDAKQTATHPPHTMPLGNATSSGTQPSPAMVLLKPQSAILAKPTVYKPSTGTPQRFSSSGITSTLIFAAACWLISFFIWRWYFNLDNIHIVTQAGDTQRTNAAPVAYLFGISVIAIAIILLSVFVFRVVTNWRAGGKHARSVGLLASWICFLATTAATVAVLTNIGGSQDVSSPGGVTLSPPSASSRSSNPVSRPHKSQSSTTRNLAITGANPARSIVLVHTPCGKFAPPANLNLRTSPQWEITSSQTNGNGTWKMQPVLTVNGVNYPIPTPQHAIHYLTEIKSAGGTGDVDGILNQFRVLEKEFFDCPHYSFYLMPTPTPIPEPGHFRHVERPR